MAANAETPIPAWQRGRVAGWLVTVDHKRIGILYIATSGVFFLAGGVMAMLMRTQLSQAGNDFLTRDSYNEVMTMHGTTMVFLVVVPILAGFGNFLVPLMIGARDMAFPRLNALSYWLFLFGGVILLFSFFAAGRRRQVRLDVLPAALRGDDRQRPGPLDPRRCTCSRSRRSPARSTSSSRSHNMRTQGMTWTRMPLFIWAIEHLRRAARGRAADALGGADAAAARPPGRHALLPARRGRERRALPARLLVLRAPRGLHHGAAGLRDDLGDHPRLRAQADLRLQGGRVLDGRDRLLLDARVGAPHVHGRDARRS